MPGYQFPSMRTAETFFIWARKTPPAGDRISPKR
jgi:hypothetical protein